MGAIHSHNISRHNDSPQRETIWSSIFKQENAAQFQRKPTLWNRLRKSSRSLTRKSNLAKNGLGNHRKISQENIENEVLHKDETVNIDYGSAKKEHVMKLGTNTRNGCHNSKKMDLKHIGDGAKSYEENIRVIDKKSHKKKQVVKNGLKSHIEDCSSIVYRECAPKNENYGKGLIESDFDVERNAENSADVDSDDFDTDVSEELTEMEDLCSSILARKQKSLTNKNEDLNNGFVFSDSESELNTGEARQNGVLYFNDEAIYPQHNYPDNFVSQVSVIFQKKIVLSTRKVNNMDTIEEGDEDEQSTIKGIPEQKKSCNINGKTDSDCEFPVKWSFQSTLPDLKSRFMFIPPKISVIENTLHDSK